QQDQQQRRPIREQLTSGRPLRFRGRRRGRRRDGYSGRAGFLRLGRRARLLRPRVGRQAGLLRLAWRRGRLLRRPARRTPGLLWPRHVATGRWLRTPRLGDVAGRWLRRGWGVAGRGENAVGGVGGDWWGGG